MWTIGHSTRSVETVAALVRAEDVDVIADVRKIPHSRRHPQWSASTLPAALAEAGLRYVHLPELGGLRRERVDSVNRAWRNPVFRAYADYMQTREFADALDRLLGLGASDRVAIMCAEADWSHCHRSLIADALVARSEPVWHITASAPAAPHRLRDFARVENGAVSYPGEPQLF